MPPRIVVPAAVLIAACGADETAVEAVDTAGFSEVIVEATGANPAAEAAANEITDPYMREIIAEISSDE